MPEQLESDIAGDLLLTVREAASKFRVCPETIRRAYRSGHLRTQQIGRHIRIPRRALIEWRQGGCRTQPQQEA
jgi:excisionase family DNA binding protein